MFAFASLGTTLSAHVQVVSLHSFLQLGDVCRTVQFAATAKRCCTGSKLSELVQVGAGWQEAAA
eukprot:6009435-Pleurochrysis_carterae.AAC.4